ncbi:MAG: FHA domain-containing protein [Gaiellaceae bacterium]
MALASTSVDGVLLALKIAFIFLLYVFIWRVIRAAGREMRTPQDSFVTAPLAERHEKRASRPGFLVVVSSPDLEEDERLELTHEPLTVGRGPLNDLQLLEDDFASGRHALFDPRRDGVWIEDLGSTNGTFVNGVRLTSSRRLAPGDIVRIGETDFRYEQ